MRNTVRLADVTANSSQWPLACVPGPHGGKAWPDGIERTGGILWEKPRLEIGSDRSRLAHGCAMHTVALASTYVDAGEHYG